MRPTPVASPDACRVGLLGLGTVGSAVARLLSERADELARQAGVPIVLHRVAVAHPERARAVSLPPGTLVGDARAVVADPAVAVVVEVMGGIEPARSYLLEALAGGKAVVTANKQLMSTRGDELHAAAEAAGVDLCFEASVAGGLPIIKTIREALAGNRIRQLLGIINGTTNFILTRMTRDGVSFGEALADAQQRGFAEADPTDDIDGHDAAAKLAILASVAFGCRVTSADVYREGIGEVTPRMIAYSRELGYVVKPLAIARNDGGAVEVRVHPALLPAHHPLAGVGDEVNAVLIEADPVGLLMLEGPGAGGGPTASAVLGDVVDVARNLRAGAAGRLGGMPRRRLPLREVADTVLPYCVAMEVADRPGVFARVAAAFGDEQVSIASIVQKSRGVTADVVLVTHEAPEAAMRRVIGRLRQLDVVRSVHAALRIAA
ncbi:MAG: homoserine dehydrogenase [Armatimonadota bacterium]|nr:homoserine dehydrogenase [Armatimonadota bacterium]